MTDIPPFTHFVQELRMFTSEYVGRNKELSLRNVTAQLFSVLFYFFVIKKKKERQMHKPTNESGRIDRSALRRARTA